MISDVEPLRILSVANVPKNRNAGAAGTELETIEALRELGHEVTDVWADRIGRRIAHGNLHQMLELPRRYEHVVRGELEKRRYDIVHVNQPHGYRAAKLVQKRWPRSVFVHRSHGFEPRVEEVLAYWQPVYGSDPRASWRRAASAAIAALLARHSREIVRWADGHILCSTQDAEFMVERFGVDRERAAVLMQAAPNAFLGDYQPLTAERLRTVLYVGQYIFIKAPMIVAGAMNRIAAQRPEVRFVWVAGTEHHEAIRALLSDDVRARIELIPWQPQEALRDIYDRAGVFLFPSFFEGFGKVHVEALSRGLCVIASDVGGMRDVMQHGRSGLLVPAGDAEAFAREAIALMNDPERAARIGRGGAERARELSWRRVAVETADFYRRLLARKRA